MWTLIILYAIRALSAPPAHIAQAMGPASPSAKQTAPAPQPPDEMSLEDIAAVDPIVRQYFDAARRAETQLVDLRKSLGERHPRVNEMRARVKVMKLRADEFAAKYRQDPTAVRAYQNPEILKALQAIDLIDIEMEMLRPNAGPTHPRVRTLDFYRAQHQKRIEKILWGGMT